MVKKKILIPEYWTEVNLNHVATVVDSRHYTPKYFKSGYPLILPNNVKTSGLDLENTKFTNEEDYLNLIKDGRDPQIGDIVYTRNASFGGSYLITKKQNFSLGQDLVLIKPKKIVPYLLISILNSELISRQLNTLITGSTFKRINVGLIREFKLIIPEEKKEQQKIAKTLSDIGNLIDKLETLIEKKKNIKNGAMQELLTEKRRLEGFSGKWKTVRLGNLMGIFTGNSKSKFIVNDGKYLIMDMGSVSSEGKNISQKYTNYEDDFLQLGDLVMPKDDIGGGNIIGKTAFIDKNEKYILGDHVYALRKKSVNIDPLFISYLINSYSINHEIHMKVTGSAQLGINKTSIEEQMIEIPSDFEEQKTISQILSDMDSEIQQLEKQLEKYTNLKQAMMQKLLTGEIRLV
jgi:type I restriction enzyme, S subunit